MEAIGLNPIRLDAIGVDPIRMNAIKLGVPGAVPGSGGSYIDPEVLDALVGIWIADQNTNDSPTRNIIKNKLPNKGGDFEILNAAYKLNSGYGEYGEDFTRFRSPFGALATVKHDAYNIKGTISNGWLIYLPNNTKTNQTKVSISGIKDNYYLIYDYHQNDGNFRLEIKKDGVYDIPANDGLGDGRGSGFMLVGISGDTNIDITIKQIPSYQGAFVTDGVDDMIVSQKKTLEIIGDNQPYTVISMLQYNGGNINYFNNAIGTTKMNKNYVSINNINKLGIFGYSSPSVGTTSTVINNILGDAKDYATFTENATAPVDRRFSVEGYIGDGVIKMTAQVAWYWTFIAKRVLTTDEINQVIAYYNLDKYVTPDVYYDVKKQGITNDNHAEFGDKLIDYSGNGRDMQLYNIGWEGMSGVNGYPVVFGANKTWEKGLINYYGDYVDNKIHVTKVKIAGNGLFFSYVKENSTIKNIKEIPPFKIKVSGLEGKSKVFYRYLKTENAITSTILVLDNGIHELPKSFTPTNTLNDYTWIGFSITPIQDGVLEFDCNITIEVLPEYENSIVYDGATDYGQYVGDLGLKDYTVVADRAYVEAKGSQVPIISNVVDGSVNTPFLMEHLGIEKILAPHSFSTYTRLSELNINRFISYQSTYKYNGSDIIKGTSTNTGSGLTIGRIGGVASQYGKICLWSLLLFPYTLSEFLLERQLKKRKLGTLYPDMVEWRPVINADISTIFDISFKLNDSKTISVGEYIPINSGVSIRIDLKKYQLDEVSLLKVNGQAIQMRKLGDYWKGDFTVTKSPQKIDITIDEYIRYEDIGQPYPALFSFYETENPDKVLTWGSKLRVGSTIKVKSITHLLGELYNITKYVYNDKHLSYVDLMSKEFVVKNNLSFKTNVTYILNNEPNCILSPERLRLSNETYKILGYIPDISGHGNHGKLNNSAYAEGSGVNADGSYGLDGVDDFISIPTLSSGGKQILSKINWNKKASNWEYLIDQRGSISAGYITRTPSSLELAYNSASKTYIDGVLNTNIQAVSLQNITHNVLGILPNIDSISPYIGRKASTLAEFFTGAIYTFMLFDEISTEEEIKELNEIVGIEGNTNDLFNPTN